ncbi:MAG: hypothetical protein U1F06_01365 [Steroidobacteraceae bacterium]
MKLHPGSWPAISLLALGMTAAHAAPPATSAYTTDSQFTYVEDATSQSIGQVNMIVCIMHAMRPDALVNEGAYLALVDQNECDKNHRSSSSNSSGGDGAAQAASYMTATVDSTRASNTDPMVAKIWIDDDSGNGPMTIWAHLNATEAPSDANPYGGFRLDFCGKPNAGGDGSCMMNGFMQGGDGTLSYYQAETQPGRSATTALKLTSVGTTSGSGRLDAQRSEGNFSTEMIFNFAYNAGLFLRGDQCFSRDATDPATGQSVWRYGLYDATSGARIDRNSGFPIEYTNGGTTYHGYLGYWGLSLPASAQATLTNGATVEKVDYNGGSSAVRTPYTVVLSPGKLTKYTRQTRTLQQLDKIRFNTWVGDASSFYVGATSNTGYELYWDDAAGHFVVTGTQVCGNNGCQLHSLDAPQSVSAAFWTNNGIQGWSQSLGGELYIDLHGAGASPDSSVVNVVYRKSDLVYPSDFPATLYCVSNCPSVASLQAFFGGSPPTDSPFGASFNAWGQVPAGNVVTYTGDATNAQLLDGSGAAVALTDASAYAQWPQYQNGVRSGRLVANLADAECSPGSEIYCDYRIGSAEVYYVWETGPNNWNRFAAVKDANGAFVQFDAPLQVTFDVPQGAQYGEYAGSSLVLQYGSFGDLWGIPGSCVSHLTNLPVSCDTDGSRYVPEFVIPYDDVLGVVHDGDTTYLVKWLEREIRFARKPLSDCTDAGLTTSAGAVLPTAADLKDPSDPASDIYTGVKPTVTDAPRVVRAR